MKKLLSIAVIVIITAFLMSNLYSENRNKEKLQNESRGVFISYIEYIKYFKEKDKQEIEKQIEKMIDNVKKYNLNTIYLQVRAFSDSIYKSSYFPFTHTISKTQGVEVGLDILEYFVETAKLNNIEVYAWVNPYRISNETDISIISEKNPAYNWLNTSKVKIIEGKGIYYNPASSEVKRLIINGISEIVENYNVAGIILDDYFYPDDTIDIEEYNELKETISLMDFRLSNTNDLISNIYKEIKKIDKNVKFGISPDANINNNYDVHYADVKTWLSKEGYIDFIMPQLYYGFFHQSKPFIKTINEWNDLITNDVVLIPALSLYKIGSTDNYAGTGRNEWIENSNMIKRQIQVSRNIFNYQGFSLFRYEFLDSDNKNVNLHNEINEYLMLFK